MIDETDKTDAVRDDGERVFDARDLVSVLSELIVHCEDDRVIARAVAMRDRMIRHAPGTGMNVTHPSLPEETMRQALTAAFDVLETSDLRHPTAILIVQANRPDGSMGRTMASTINNPYDLIRVVLANAPKPPPPPPRHKRK